MAALTPEQLDGILTRGFEPASGYDPLIPVYGANASFPGFLTVYQAYDIPYVVKEIGSTQDFASGQIALDEDIWFSAIPSGPDSFPANVIGVHLTVGSHTVGGQPVGDATITWILEDGTLSPDAVWYIDAANMSSYLNTFDVQPCYLSLTYRLDLSQPELLWGIKYNAYKVNSDPGIVTPELATTRAMVLAGTGSWRPNEPYLQWITNNNTGWYDAKSQVPSMGEGGGGGSWNLQSDTVGYTPLPSLDLAASNFFSQYCLSMAQLSDLGDYMWDPSFVNSIAKLWGDPMSNIISLCFFPLSSAQLDTSAGTVQVGNIDTGVGGLRLNKYLYDFDCGRLAVKEIWNNFGDYSPYHKVSIHIPFCGKKELNPDDYVDGEIGLRYHIDTFSGTCVAELLSVRHGRTHVVDAFPGNMTTQIPISGANYMSAYAAAFNGVMQMTSGAITGNVAGALGGAASLVTAKPSYEKSGSTTGAYGRFSPHVPYLFREVPQFREPDNYRLLHGYVANGYQKLGDCEGYVDVKYMDLSGLAIPDICKDRILQKLRDGVHIH